MYRSTLSDHVIAVCFQDNGILITSLRSRRLEVVGREKGHARGRHARGVSPPLSPSRAPIVSCSYYFQAPATQAI